MDYVPVDYFEVAMEHVFYWEGGYVDDPHDPGGETNHGISKRSYPTVDIKNLTKEGAKVIYRADYWSACRCDQLPGPLALMVFDAAVNQGVSRAVRFLQEALGVKQDGIIGPMTIEAAKRSQLKLVMLKFSVRRALHYASLSTFNRYGKGWMSRLFDGYATALTTYVQEARLQKGIP